MLGIINPSNYTYSTKNYKTKEINSSPERKIQNQYLFSFISLYSQPDFRLGQALKYSYGISFGSSVDSLKNSGKEKIKEYLQQKLDELPPTVTSIDDLDKKDNICFMFGAFNPIHLTHIKLAQKAMEQYGFDNVILIPLAVPAHKKNHPDLISLDKRIDLLRFAAADDPRLIICDTRAFGEAGSEPEKIISRFAPKLFDSDKPIPSIIGSDAVKTLSAKSMHLISKSRFLQAETFNIPYMDKVIIDGEEVKLNTVPLEMPMSEIRSTGVRRNIKEGKDIDHFVFEDVALYIWAHDLYKNKLPEFDILS